MAAELVAVAHDKKLPDRRTCKHHQNQHQPVLWVVVSEAVMPAEHGKQHWQGEIGVVHAALLAALAMHRVHRLAGLDCRNHFFLARNNPKKHARTHASRQHRPHQQKGRTPGKPVTGQPRCHANQQKHQGPNNGLAVFALAQGATNQVIEQPKNQQKRKCCGNRRGRRPVHF